MCCHVGLLSAFPVCFFAGLARQVKWLLMSESSAPPAWIILFNGVWILPVLQWGKMCKADPWDLTRASQQVIILKKELCGLFTWDMTRDKPCLKWGHLLAGGNFFFSLFHIMGISHWKAALVATQVLISPLNLPKKLRVWNIWYCKVVFKSYLRILFLYPVVQVKYIYCIGE